MTLPASGPISASNINTEFGYGSTAQISLGTCNVCCLLQGNASGVSMCCGYSQAKSRSITINLNTNTTSMYCLRPACVTNYWTCFTTVNLCIGLGICIGNSGNCNPSLCVAPFATGDTINIVNCGYIMGIGGNGGGCCGSLSTPTPGAGCPGKPALSIANNINLTNYCAVLGGGGGGGAALMHEQTSGFCVWGGGGGGAGGGGGGWGRAGCIIGHSNCACARGGYGDTPGSAGSYGCNGCGIFVGTNGYGCVANGCGGGYACTAGAGGGFVNAYLTGGAGSGGGGRSCYPGVGGNGGWGLPACKSGGDCCCAGCTVNYNNNSQFYAYAGGGGGWGAIGGTGVFGNLCDPSGIGYAGGAGGNAICLNGKSVTYITTGTIWGAVS